MTFSVSPSGNRDVAYNIPNAFTADGLNLAEHSCPVSVLQKQYPHLQGLPLSNLARVAPLILIGSDHPHLVTPTKPMRAGPKGGPVAVHTLGWSVQGPAHLLLSTSLHSQAVQSQQVLFTRSNPSPCPATDLLWNVEMPWKKETFSNRKLQEVTHS